MNLTSKLAFPRIIFVGFLACLSVPCHAAAQQNAIALEAGIIEYDAGGDQTYPSFTLRGWREVLPWLRLGLGVSLGAIGEIPRDSAFEDGGSESLWRFFTTATAVSHRPFRNSGIAVVDRMSPEIGFGIGVVHSSGLEVNPEIFEDPFNGIEDEPTGLALGAALGLAFEVDPRWAIRLTGGYWSDHLYGGALDDFELTGGVQLGW